MEAKNVDHIETESRTETARGWEGEAESRKRSPNADGGRSGSNFLTVTIVQWDHYNLQSNNTS